MNTTDKFNHAVLVSLLDFSMKGMNEIGEEHRLFVHENINTLENLDPLFLYEELKKILCGPYVLDVLREFHDVVTLIVPELKPMIGFKQHNRFHAYDLWGHTIRSVSAIRPDPILRMIMLFHDCGKPNTFTWDEKGQGHFYGHPEESAKIVRSYLERIGCDEKEINLIEHLVRYHDERPPISDRSMRKFFKLIGENLMPFMLEIKMADGISHARCAFKRWFEDIARVHLFMSKTQKEREEFNKTKLQINGKKLMSIGIPAGPMLGKILDALFEEVINGTLHNNMDDLCDRALVLHKKFQ